MSQLGDQMFKFTKAEVAAIGRTVGLTIRWVYDWGEFRVYPIGTGKHHDSAYFTDDAEDAVRTALAMVKGKPLGERRPFTTTEQLDISDTQWWFLETDYAEHPIGDTLDAIGDNVYRVTRGVSQWEYFYSIKEAMEAA